MKKETAGNANRKIMFHIECGKGKFYRKLVGMKNSAGYWSINNGKESDGNACGLMIALPL